VAAAVSRPLSAPPPLLSAGLQDPAPLLPIPVAYDRLLSLGQRSEAPLLGLEWTLSLPAPAVIPYQGPDAYGRLTVQATVPPERAYATGAFRLDFPRRALLPETLQRLSASGATLAFQRLTARPESAPALDFRVSLEMIYVAH
jgi:hypothetical protein